MSVHPSRRQRILLTGATGFTGQHLRRIAADKGYDVVSLRCDICCFNSVLQQVQDADFDYVVINNKLDQAVLELESVILGSRCRTDVRKAEIQMILKSFK